jgi:hypothetical protein
MDTRQNICCLRDVGSFLGVFPSDLLPNIVQSATLIVNTDRHTESGSHWLAIQIQLHSSKLYYFDSYVLPPLIHSIQSFINRKCTVWDYNSVQLQGHTTAVCGKYSCLFSFTRIEVIHPKNSSRSLAPLTQTRGFPNCSRRSLVPCQNGGQRRAM